MNPTRTPAWAAGFTDTTYRRLVDLCRATFRRHGLRVRYDPDEGVFRVRDDRGDVASLGIINLAADCLARPLEEWSTLVEGHLERMLGSGDVATDLAQDWPRASRLLRSRLVAADSLEPREAFLARPVAPGLIEALVVDLPEMMMFVTLAMANAWGRSSEELWAIGRRNLRAAPSPTLLAGGFNEDVTITVAVPAPGEEHYVASQALLLFEEWPTSHAAGLLFAVPRSSDLFVVPVDSGPPIAAAGALAALAESLASMGPRAVSPEVYWWHDGSIERVPHQLRRGSEGIEIEIDLPAALTGERSTRLLH